MAIPNTLADAAERGLPEWLANAHIPSIWVGWPHVLQAHSALQQVVPRAFAGSPTAYQSSVPLADCHVTADSIDWSHLEPFFPEADSDVVLNDPATPALQTWLAEAGSLQAAATRLMQRADWRLASIRFELGDQIERTFGDCHPPLGDQVDPARVLRYQYLVTGAYRFLDMILARLIQLAGEDYLLVLHSEQGTALPATPVVPDAPVHIKHRAAHRDRGFIVLSGKRLRQGEPLWASSSLDVAPTIFFALGHSRADHAGRVLREGFDPDQWPVPTAIDDSPSSVVQIDEAIRQSLLADYVAHGECPASDAIDTGKVDLEQRLYLALSQLQSGAARQALAMLTSLNDDFPTVRRLVLHRARAHLSLGELEAAEAWIERFLEMGTPDLRSHLMLGRIALLQNDPQKALVHFFQAEQLQPEDPTSHCQLGDAYRRADQPERARDAFGRALALDSGSVPAHLGLAKIQLSEDDFEAACQSCLQALESDYRCAEAHFHLGAGLAKLEKVDEAIAAFEAAVGLQPNWAQAHEWLAKLYRLKPDGVERAAWHKAQASTLDSSTA